MQAIRHDEHANGTDTARSDFPRPASRHYELRQSPASDGRRKILFDAPEQIGARGAGLFSDLPA
jgi:hypothetical protein